LHLKNCLSIFPILALLDFTKDFFIECDTLLWHWDSIDARSIAYCLYQQALSDRTLSKLVYEKEIIAHALSTRHWHYYLLGRSFKVYTDHRSLNSQIQSKGTTRCQFN